MKLTGPGKNENCIICGNPLVYFDEMKILRCAICGKEASANASCEAGHFVCDDCHSGGGVGILAFLMQSEGKDPIELFAQVCSMSEVHMHGPEHHSIVPCVLLTAFHNNGGDIELEKALPEAWKRGKGIPGGACGFMGCCGSAVGAGIFASIICRSTPLAGDVWHIPQELTADCLKAIAAVGGPRCCKRDGRLSIGQAVKFAKEHFGIDMPVSHPDCTFSGKNSECLDKRCPYHR